MAHLRTRAVAAGATIAICLTSAHASSPKFFQAATQADFLKGDVENLSIDGSGRLVLGPATELVYETSAPFVWSMIAGTDGALFVGTGNEGKVFRVDTTGNGKLFFQAGELEAHALAPAPDGGLYVATSPDGRIYKVDKDGKSSTFFDPEDKYIWALAIDKAGNVYAGTGEKGLVYRIAPDGKGAPFYKATATHVTALAFDHAGNLLVGTEAPGRVVRVDASGKPFLLLDSPFQEIRTIRVDAKGLVYAAALSGRPSSGSSSVSEPIAPERVTAEAARAPVPSVSAEITSMAIVDVSPASSGSTTPVDRRSLKGAVYRITPDGVWDQLWDSREDSPYDLTFDQNGAVVIGTGNKGKIYRLEGEPVRPVLLTRAGAQQVTSFHRDARGRFYYATANPAKLFRIATERASRGTYESEPRDAQMVSTWGTIGWHGNVPPGARIELFTRSGNTETPDDTWSGWSGAYVDGEGTSITSPKSRYLQWRAVLTGTTASPVLTSVTAAYLQRNLRPQVRSITVNPPGIVYQKPFSTGEPEIAGFENQVTPERKLAAAASSSQQGGAGTPTLGRKTYQKGLQTFIWKADDENEDDLVYDVLYRREGETTWTPLRRALEDPILVWDTTTVPNGTYFVKIVASDAASNPAVTALAGELESSAFDVDNTPPLITITDVQASGGNTAVTFDVKDDHSPVQRVEISRDGQHWRSVFPRDGIADSREERYQVTVEGTAATPGLIVRASDTMNNVATVEVPAPR